MSSLCLSNRLTALMAACSPFVKGSFHAFVEMINNAPSQILQKEWISCSVTVYSRSLCTRAPGLCLRCEDPDLAPLAPLALPNNLDFLSTRVSKVAGKRVWLWALTLFFLAGVIQHVYSEFSLNFCDIYQWLSGTVSLCCPLPSALSSLDVAVRDRPFFLPLVCLEGCSPAQKKRLFFTDDD